MPFSRQLDNASGSVYCQEVPGSACPWMPLCICWGESWIIKYLLQLILQRRLSSNLMDKLIMDSPHLNDFWSCFAEFPSFPGRWFVDHFPCILRRTAYSLYLKLDGELVIVSPCMMGLISIDKMLLVTLNLSSYLSLLWLHPHTTHSLAGKVHPLMRCYIWSNILLIWCEYHQSFSCQIWKKIMMYTLFLKDIQHIVMHTYVSGLSHQWFL